MRTLVCPLYTLFCVLERLILFFRFSAAPKVELTYERQHSFLLSVFLQVEKLPGKVIDEVCIACACVRAGACVCAGLVCACIHVCACVRMCGAVQFYIQSPSVNIQSPLLCLQNTFRTHLDTFSHIQSGSVNIQSHSVTFSDLYDMHAWTRLLCT